MPYLTPLLPRAGISGSLRPTATSPSLRTPPVRSRPSCPSQHGAAVFLWAIQAPSAPQAVHPCHSRGSASFRVFLAGCPYDPPRAARLKSDQPACAHSPARFLLSPLVSCRRRAPRPRHQDQHLPEGRGDGVRRPGEAQGERIRTEEKERERWREIWCSATCPRALLTPLTRPCPRYLPRPQELVTRYSEFINFPIYVWVEDEKTVEACSAPASAPLSQNPFFFCRRLLLRCPPVRRATGGSASQLPSGELSGHLGACVPCRRRLRFRRRRSPRRRRRHLSSPRAREMAPRWHSRRAALRNLLWLLLLRCRRVRFFLSSPISPISNQNRRRQRRL